MNRDIKFRGKRADNGQWVYGNLILSNGNSYITKGILGEFIRVLPHTVGQYIGIEIGGESAYEGDITQYGIISFYNDIGYDCGGGSHPGFYYGLELEYHDGLNDEDLKIIGNIHDNTELL